MSLKNGAWNSGKNFDKGSLSDSNPCSASCNSATAENCLETEAMQKLVSRVTGALVTMSATPKQRLESVSPPCMMSTAAPGSLGLLYTAPKTLSMRLVNSLLMPCPCAAVNDTSNAAINKNLFIMWAKVVFFQLSAIGFSLLVGNSNLFVQKTNG